MVFTKAVGSGNDFILIDDRTGKVSEPAELAKDLCRRRLSIGADGLLLLNDPERGDFRMRIFNPDGSEAEMCGNGLRCFLLYLVRKGLAAANKCITVETKAGLRRGKVEDDIVIASLGEPADLALSFPVKFNGKEVVVNFVNTGVPHTVIEVSSVETSPVLELGRKIRSHPRFAPAGTNVDFVEVRENLVLIRTYERGVEDETLSCGTGTAAAGWVLFRLGKIKLPVQAKAASGEILTVSEKEGEVFLAGEVRIVYEGSTVG